MPLLSPVLSEQPPPEAHKSPVHRYYPDKETKAQDKPTPSDTQHPVLLPWLLSPPRLLCGLGIQGEFNLDMVTALQASGKQAVSYMRGRQTVV